MCTPTATKNATISAFLLPGLSQFMTFYSIRQPMVAPLPPPPFSLSFSLSLSHSQCHIYNSHPPVFKVLITNQITILAQLMSLVS